MIRNLVILGPFLVIFDDFWPSADLRKSCRPFLDPIFDPKIAIFDHFSRFFAFFWHFLTKNHKILSKKRKKSRKMVKNEGGEGGGGVPPLKMAKIVKIDP